MQQVLQFALDPRVVFAGGLCFFGGLVLFAEISQCRERKKRPPADDGDARN